MRDAVELDFRRRLDGWRVVDRYTFYPVVRISVTELGMLFVCALWQEASHTEMTITLDAKRNRVRISGDTFALPAVLALKQWFELSGYTAKHFLGPN